MNYQTSLQNFLNNSNKHRDKPYLHQPIDGKWHTFSFNEVEQQARAIAQGLKAQGFEPGDRIGILSKNCAEWFIVDLAIMMAGMISVPIYSTAGAKTITYVIKHSEVRAMFVGKLDSLDAAIAAIPAETLTIAFPYPTINCQVTWQEWLAAYQPLTELHQAHIDDCMSIVYTSGTTGSPKGVIISYKNLASAAKCTCSVINATSNSRALSYLPLAHITERSVIEGAAFDAGFQVFFVDNLSTFIDDLQHASPTIFLSVPRLWAKFQSQILAKMPDKKLKLLLSLPIIGKQVAKKIRLKLGLSNAKVFASGSAPISISLLKWFQKIGINIGEGWGMTETSGLSCGNFPFNEQRLGSIGVPVDCVEMKLSEQNEVMIRGDAVFKEYYLNPEISKASFTDGWFHTGDKGEVTDDGAYKIVGRIKEQFKTSKGKYVIPVPIESMLCRNSDIEQVCVMGLGLKQPIALVVLAEGIDRSNSDIQKGLAETLVAVNSELESHQRLDFLFVCRDPWTIENELLTPTLKLKRDNIEQYYAGQLPKGGENKIVLQAN
ncbi:AMP-binding protein [Thalassotalea sp. ND16A]|uniref:AMP-binding protein n=1 Tax=Thalassotalea sp. ND16A TaxID=1535422 RepID=UPI00051A149F|nr:AMP-binding protein [Thalassotalea sp. ND16A]KGJ95749.1 Long-chain-fatty-acid--CoA ligase [Thalassotalea sp. ND16A]